MLGRELMGLLALAILWVNTLLVAGAAIGVLRSLTERLRKMRRDGLVEAVAAGEIAVHEIAQVGRRASDDAARQAILFHDRAFTSRVLGGPLLPPPQPSPASGGGSFTTPPEPPASGGGSVRLAAEGERAEVWIAAGERAAAGACGSADAFDEAYAASGKARGFERTVRCAIGEGARVWIHGRTRDGELGAADDAPLLVATFDPARWCRARVLLLAGFVVAIVAAAAAITAIALTPPVFGLASTLGGAAGLVFFLLVQPAGTAVRDAARVPPVAFLRGSWVKPGSEGRGGPEAVPSRG